MAASTQVVGAGLLVIVNGTLLGTTTSFSWESVTEKKAIYALDASEPYEMAPTTTRVTGAISFVRPSLVGGLEAQGITVSFADQPRQKYVNIIVLDKKTGLPVFETDSAVILRQRWSGSARGVMEGSLSFEAVDWRDEYGSISSLRG
jgi:hypothetical protein